MQQGFKPQPSHRAGSANISSSAKSATSSENTDLMRARMELVAARDRGEQGALGRMLLAYPAYAAALIDLDAALVATSGYDHVKLTPSVERIAKRAQARAFDAAFGSTAAPALVADVARVAPLSLKALRKARKLTLTAVAEKLAIGADVLSALEAGMIRAASAPERLARMLSESLDAPLDQVRDALQRQALAVPAWQRGRDGVSPRTANQPENDFMEAVRRSPNMTQEQKNRWLKEDAGKE